MRKIAIAAGSSLLVMAIAAAFSYGFVHGSLVVEGDAGATVRNLTASASRFRAGLFGWLVILICDVVVAWALYLYLEAVHRGISLLGAWLRIVYTAVLGAALANLWQVALLVGGTEGMPLPDAAALPAIVTLYLEGFETMWSVGLIVFGAHLAAIGWLALQSNRIPNALGVLLLIAGAGYAIVHAGDVFLPQWSAVVAVVEAIFMLPMIAGELGFGLWLLFRGGRTPAIGITAAAPAATPPESVS